MGDMNESGENGRRPHRAHADRPADPRRLAWGWWFFAALALFFLLSEHRAHFFGVLPYLLLLACPLMHLFMHHGHGHGGHGSTRAGQREDNDGEDRP